MFGDNQGSGGGGGFYQDQMNNNNNGGGDGGQYGGGNGGNNHYGGGGGGHGGGGHGGGHQQWGGGNRYGGGGGGYHGGGGGGYHGGGGGRYNRGGGGGGGYNDNHNKRSKVFTPVTLKMVQHSLPRPDDVCEYDGDAITDIIIVGRILRRIEEPMRTQFEINDTTGSYHVTFYHKGENQVPTALRMFKYEQFTYAKIYGNIRVFKEDKAIIGTHIERINKMEVITNHFLSVFVSQQIRKKGVLKQRELAMDVSGTATGFLESNPNAMTMVDQQPSKQRGPHGGYGNNQQF